MWGEDFHYLHNFHFVLFPFKMCIDIIVVYVVLGKRHAIQITVSTLCVLKA
jgi:hypothetical protein